ncbi:FkbM family methyltransferase [Nostoc sp. CHAB 5834]|nr:FkbM family methyltransferase [Nostoc sp. CHAB 5834]
MIVKKNKKTINITFNERYNSPVTLRSGDHDSDIAVFKQILCWEEYRAVVKIYRSYFKEDVNSIVDAGGNIGLTSLYFSAHFPHASIVSIEPDPENFELLNANLRGYNVNCLLGAVWSRNCQLTLVNDFRDHSSWSRRVVESEELTSNSVTAYSLAHIKQLYQFEYIDILKIDVEGAEKELFMAEDLSFLKITKCVAIEIHDEFKCRDAIYKRLDEYGFLRSNSGELTIGINQNFIL